MIYSEDKKIQLMGELEEQWHTARALYAKASYDLSLAKAKHRLKLEASNELSPRGQKKSPSAITAQLIIDCDAEPLLSLRLNKLEMKAKADAAGVQFHAAKHSHFSR